MTLNDSLAGVLSQIDNATKVGKTSIVSKFSSKVIKDVLQIMKDEGYVEEIIITEDSKGDILKVVLSNNLNKCGVIKPRFAIKVSDYVKFETKFLPARDFGVLIVSTNQGLMTHTKAKELGLGGKLISFSY